MGWAHRGGLVREGVSCIYVAGADNDLTPSAVAHEPFGEPLDLAKQGEGVNSSTAGTRALAGLLPLLLLLPLLVNSLTRQLIDCRCSVRGVSCTYLFIQLTLCEGVGVSCSYLS